MAAPPSVHGSPAERCHSPPLVLIHPFDQGGLMSATITSLPHRGEQSDAPMERSAASIEDLEDEISSLACRIAQHTCRFLELLAAFDEAGGWHDRGFVSASQWLSWRCGMTETTAREHMRVARALPRLPLITAEFRSRSLSYFLVRALARVATVDSVSGLA